MTDLPAEAPAEDPAQKPPPEPSDADVAGYKAHAMAISEATHTHLEEVVRPSLLPTPNSGEDLPDEPEEDDFPSTAHPPHPSQAQLMTMVPKPTVQFPEDELGVMTLN